METHADLRLFGYPGIRFWLVSSKPTLRGPEAPSTDQSCSAAEATIQTATDHGFCHREVDFRHAFTHINAS